MIHNINLPDTDDEWQYLANEWSTKMLIKKRQNIMKGTTLALDGLVVETSKPRLSDVNGNLSGFFNRKGSYAMVALAAVDVWGSFRYCSMNWEGSTHDLTAYYSSRIHEILHCHQLPNHLHIVADEAFSSCGPQVLTPYSKSMLYHTRIEDHLMYERKLMFNRLLSSQ